MDKAKVTKIMVWPSRTIGLPNYNSVKLNAGIEIEFDKPITLKSKEVKDAFNEARKTIVDEFKKQDDTFGRRLEKKGGEK